MLEHWVFFIVIIVIILCLYASVTSCSQCYESRKIQEEEHFTDTYKALQCESCDNKNLGQCLECSTCGYFGNDYYGVCIGGDMVGPYEPELKKLLGTNSFVWKYGDRFWNKAHKYNEHIDVPFVE
jgi:hypothetical protein